MLHDVDVVSCQVLCVNESLKMGKGKIGAQCAHAAVGVVQQYRGKQELAASFRAWEYGGQAKIALKLDGVEEMVNIRKGSWKKSFADFGLSLNAGGIGGQG